MLALESPTVLQTIFAVMTACGALLGGFGGVLAWRTNKAKNQLEGRVVDRDDFHEFADRLEGENRRLREDVERLDGENQALRERLAKAEGQLLTLRPSP